MYFTGCLHSRRAVGSSSHLAGNLSNWLCSSAPHTCACTLDKSCYRPEHPNSQACYLLTVVIIAITFITNQQHRNRSQKNSSSHSSHHPVFVCTKSQPFSTAASWQQHGQLAGGALHCGHAALWLAGGGGDPHQNRCSPAQRGQRFGCALPPALCPGHSSAGRQHHLHCRTYCTRVRRFQGLCVNKLHSQPLATLVLFHTQEPL